MTPINSIKPTINDRVFTIKDFQSGFYNSSARFPAFVASWGTGKTTMMILKAYTLSHIYNGNYGVIFRKTERSLRSSTIRDFEDYTGIKVPQSNPEIVIPQTGSVIKFAHADDMRGLTAMLQNVNLGWIGIEQAEELDTGAVFDMLRGRLRRIVTPVDSIQDQLIQLGVLKERVSSFRHIPNIAPDFERNKVIDVIINRLHLPYNQMMIIANTNGHNWIWRRWKKNTWPGYELHEARSEENIENIPAETMKDWKQLAIENPKRYARMVMNSWEDYDMEGAYYAELMSDSLKAGRQELDTLYDPTVPVYTFWDLGVRASDTTAIWFVQFMGHEIWLVDYLEHYGKGMGYYSDQLNAKPYTYAAHYLPPDAVARLQGEEITTRVDIMRKLRREPIRIVPRHRIEERIACTRGLLSRCKFHTRTAPGIESLNNYKAKKSVIASTEDQPVFTSAPLHNEFSNGADSFGYMAVIKRYNPPVTDVAYSNSDDVPWLIHNDIDEGTDDILRFSDA